MWNIRVLLHGGRRERSVIFFLLFKARQKIFLRACLTSRHLFCPYQLHIYSSRLHISISLNKIMNLLRNLRMFFLPFLKKLDIWSHPKKVCILKKTFCNSGNTYSFRRIFLRSLSCPLSRMIFDHSGRSLESKITRTSVFPELDLTTNVVVSGPCSGSLASLLWLNWVFQEIHYFRISLLMISKKLINKNTTCSFDLSGLVSSGKGKKYG